MSDPLLSPTVTLPEPCDVGPWTLVEMTDGAIWSVSLSRDVDPGWPSVGTMADGVLRLGGDLAFVQTDGSPPEMLVGMWGTDQTEAWVRLEVTGSDLRPALELLVALDLSKDRFPDGSCARTVAAHLALILCRHTCKQWELWTPSSSVDSFLHHLTEAMEQAA